MGESELLNTTTSQVATFDETFGAVGPPGRNNPSQVAILRWYAANQTADFSVGTNPYGVAFDGANIWVTNFGSNTVSKR